MFSLDDKQAKNSNLLEVKVKNYGECSFCQDEENKESLKIPWSIFSQWLYILQRMGSREWGAVFWVKDNAITNFKIPKQRVSSTECEFQEDLGGDGIVHSHHEMGAFHSSQDDHHARNLYIYSIVISSSGYAATKKIKLPCNGFGYQKAELYLTGCPEIEFSRIAEKEAFNPLATQEHNQQQSDFKPDKLPCDRCTTQDCQNCAYFSLNNTPCDNCISFKCKECELTKNMDISEVLPFCDFCEDYGCCISCIKLAKFLANYPQDKKQYEYLLANQERG